MEKMIEEAKMLFEHFGWYAVLLVLGTTLLMIPINMGYKKLMKKDELNRLRKTMSSVSVFVVAGLLVAFCTGVILREGITLSYLIASSSCCGSLSMVLWAVIKLVRDYGFAPILNAVANSKEAKAWLKELGVSETLVALISKNVGSYMKEKNIASLDEYVKNELVIANQIRVQLNGFVANEKINQVVNNILQPIKAKLK
jgi:hypothetical protein